MYGFRINIGKPVDRNFPEDEHCFLRHWDGGKTHIVQWSLRKFERDKLWLDTPDYLVAVEGVLFNRSAIEQNPHLPVHEWRGSFACVQVNKKTEEVTVYTDQTGSHLIFWCETEEGVFVSSDFFELSHVSGLHQPDEVFAMQILERGYGKDSHTMVEGIHRLCAGERLCIAKGQVSVSHYHTFRNEPFHAKEEDSITKTDHLFRQAVQRVLDKNEEYGYSHVFPLSGGLDSRMAQVVARQLTKRPIHNFTYSQAGHYDHLLPEQISHYLGNSWQFLPLDGGDYLRQIDAITHTTQALVNYNAPSESYYCSTQIDLSNAGVVLTGVNGDNIFSVETDHAHEIERLYSLSFAGNGLGSPLVFQQYTESYSPFCDVDVLEYVLRVPLSRRWNYHFYDEWILRYYPEATQWDHKGQRIGHRRIVLSIMGRNIALRDLPKRILAYAIKHTTGHNIHQIKEGASMNPYDTWVKENALLHDTIHDYYESHKELLNDYPILQTQAETIMHKHPVYDQCGVLTILSSLSQLS